jgi:hypothetical protein
MKLIIDSKPVKLSDNEPTSFSEYCAQIMEWLLERERSISKCKLDGKPIEFIEEANDLYLNSSTCEIESIPLRVAVQSALALQCNYLRVLETECEQLVTDSLLAEPKEIMRQWYNICQHLKNQIAFLQKMASLFTEKEVDAIVDTHLAQLNGLMKDAAAAINAADVVTFSDVIELKLLPWQKAFREFLLESLRKIENQPEGAQL